MFEIGNSLREARLRRGAEFAQAEAATKIRAKYLKALEEEEFELLPAQTYVKGFLRTYAEYLGLDGQLYVDEYNSRFVAGDDELRARRSAARPQRRNRRIETNVVLVALAAIAIVTVVVITAWKSAGGGGNEARLDVARTPLAQPKPRVTPPLLAVAAVRGSSYVAVHRLNATGPVAFQGTIERGQTQPFRGPRFWVSVSRPENIVLKVRGHPIRLKGHRPRIVIVTPTGIRPAA